MGRENVAKSKEILGGGVGKPQRYLSKSHSKSIGHPQEIHRKSPGKVVCVVGEEMQERTKKARVSTENGPKSVATEGPKNQENPKPWKKRPLKSSPGGGRNTRPKMKKKQQS